MANLLKARVVTTNYKFMEEEGGFVETGYTTTVCRSRDEIQDALIEHFDHVQQWVDLYEGATVLFNEHADEGIYQAAIWPGSRIMITIILYDSER